MVKSVETGWLIERQVAGRAVWWRGREGYDWTVESCEAVRFCRRQDAEAVVASVRSGLRWWDDVEVTVTDHMWIDDSEDE